MWPYLLMMGFSAIVLITMVMLCGMLKKSNTNEPGSCQTSTKTTSNNRNDSDIRVIYNPKSGSLELGSKASDPDNKMTDPDAILGGIINQNFIEMRLNDAKAGDIIVGNGTNSSVCKTPTAPNTNTGPSILNPRDGHIHKTDCSVAHANLNPAFE